MTTQEAINNLTFIRNAYQNLNENGADEFRIIGKGVNAAVEYNKVSYSEYIVALDLAISALEKQISKKPLPEEKFYGNGKCPCCNAVFLDKNTNYCGNCGQALDWSDNNDNN